MTTMTKVATTEQSQSQPQSQPQTLYNCKVVRMIGLGGPLIPVYKKYIAEGSVCSPVSLVLQCGQAWLQGEKQWAINYDEPEGSDSFSCTPNRVIQVVVPGIQLTKHPEVRGDLAKARCWLTGQDGISPVHFPPYEGEQFLYNLQLGSQIYILGFDLKTKVSRQGNGHVYQVWTAPGRPARTAWQFTYWTLVSPQEVSSVTDALAGY